MGKGYSLDVSVSDKTIITAAALIGGLFIVGMIMSRPPTTTASMKSIDGFGVNLDDHIGGYTGWK